MSPNANVIDARNRIVMPGFVDTHRHTWQTPVRGVLPSCTLDQYFSGMLDNIGIQYRAEDVYIANLMGALECLSGGITTLLDWSHVNNTPEHADAAIAGLAEAGIRAVYAHGPPVGASTWWAYSSKEHPEDVRRIRKQYFNSDDQLLTLALAARAPGNTTPEVATPRLEARARPRDSDQRARRHASHGRARQPRQDACTTSASWGRTRPTSTAPTRRTKSST